MPPKTTTKQAPQLASCRPTLATDDVLPKTVLVIGQTGAGKTTLAATRGADLSGAMQALPKDPITLNGMVWLASDEQATVALSARKILPEIKLEIRDLVSAAEGNIPQAMRWIKNLLAEAQEAGAHTLVWDTVTTLGEFLVNWYVHGDGCPTTRGGERNTMVGWGQVGKAYLSLYEEASALGYRQVILAHPKQNNVETAANETKASEADVAKAIATSAPGDNLIVPAIAGNSFRVFLQGAASIQLWLKTTDRNGKRTRSLVQQLKGVQTKNRYEAILSPEEPADLLALDNKILEALR